MNNDKQWSIGLVHGIPGVIPLMDRLVREACPGVTVFNLLHEGIFLEVVRAGKMTPVHLRRTANFLASAEESGASLILLTGTTMTPAVNTARQMVSVPLLRIDEAMAEAVVGKGGKIGLVASEEATLEPSTRILKIKADEAGKKVEIATEVAPQAMLLFREGRVAEHDALVLEKVKSLEGKVDVIVLAQVSMYGVLAQAKKLIKTPVFASPELAAARVRQVLTGLGWNQDQVN